MGYHVSTVEGISVVELSGDFWGGGETDKIGDALKNLVEGGNGRIIVDLRKTGYLNSTAIGVLVSLNTTVRRLGGKLCLANISKKIQNVLLITKLAFVFDTYGTVDEAVEALKEWKAPEGGGI